MVVPPSAAWKLLLAAALLAAIFASALAKAPKRPLPSGDLRRLVFAALALYAVGGAASLTHHVALAGLLYASGIGVCALAAWLSRGSDSEGPPGGGSEPVDEQPPPEPDGLPGFDWAAFEREFRAHVSRRRKPSGVR